MSLELADIPVELIHPTLVGSRYRALIPSGPFSEHTGGISVLLHDLRQDNMVGIIRLLTHYRPVLILTIIHYRGILPVFTVASHMSVARMLSCHQGSARRSADRTAGIGLGETHSFLSHPVQIRSLDVFLTIASQIAVSHVIAHNDENIRFFILCRIRGNSGYCT